VSRLSSFRRDQPVAWAYHRRTSRWPFNMHDVKPRSDPSVQFKEDLDADTTVLPAAQLPRLALADALRRRSSCRRFSGAAIEAAQLGTLLHAAYGVLGTVELGGEFCERPVPSGGGLYPLELYVITQNVEGLSGGVHHYVPLGHLLETVRPDPLPSLLTAEMFLGQPYLAEAAALIVITATVERSLWKYEDRGYRYILMEAGHVAQNVNLCAEALGLASLNLGGFLDEDLARLLKLDEEREIALYGLAVGVGDIDDRLGRRFPPEGARAFRQF
jgi:SagB-type dehydrogenase family enzyme